MIDKSTLRIAAECITECMKPLAKYLNDKPTVRHIDGKPSTTIDIAKVLETGDRYKQLAAALREIEAEMKQGRLFDGG